MSTPLSMSWMAEPHSGMTASTSYIDLDGDDADSAMPPLEAVTPFQHPSTAPALTTSSLSMPLPSPNSSIVIKQTTLIEKTIRTEVRASPLASHTASPAKHNHTTHRTPEKNRNNHSLNGALPQTATTPPSASAPAPATSLAVNASSRASSFSSPHTTPAKCTGASLHSSAMSPPLPDLIPPPAIRPSFSAASSPSSVSSLALSLSPLSSNSPAASTSALADAADPTDEFLENEGLYAHFTAWTPVSSAMPSQSYSAYLDTCERTLSPAALAALRKCAPGDPTAENTHTDPFPLLRAPKDATQQPFTVLQRADSEHGLLQYKLVASRAIREKEVIGFVAGHLETEHEAEREGVDKLHPSHVHINRGYMHRYLDYTHSDALVLSLKRFHNALHHIRDPALFLSDFDEKRPEVSAYNVHVDLVLDPERRVPVIVAFAWVDIEQGQELTAYLGLGVWYSRDHQRLFLASRVNHWYHRRVLAIEKLLVDKKINFQKQASKKRSSSGSGSGSGKRSSSTASSSSKVKEDSKAASTAAQSDPPGPVLSASEEWRFLGDEEKREETIAKWHREQMGSNRGMEKVELWRVFALSQCAYVTKVFLGKSVSDATKAALQQLPDFIPAHIAIGNDVVDVDAAAIRRLVEVGHDESLCEVREVTSLISPVRYFSAPWHSAFCVVARKPIKKGTFVFTYSGELEQEVRNRDSVYVYDVPRDNIRAHWPACPSTMPDMLIDAEKYGGVARFVNDSRYRLREGQAEGDAENLNHTFVFVDKCIHLCFYVTRDVKAREELVSTYGDEFWSVCTGQMLIQHRKYYNHITHYCQQLASTAHKHGLPLPDEPSYLLEAEPAFVRKPALYPDEPNPTDAQATEEEWEVEAILSKGKMSREVHYLVKWLGFADTYNSWVKKSGMACTQLISDFEQQLKQEGKADGNGAATKRKGKKKGAGKSKEETDASRPEGKEEREQSSSSESSSGGDSDDGERRKKKSKRKRQRASSGQATDDSSDAVEAADGKSSSSAPKKNKKTRKTNKVDKRQREANRWKIKEAARAVRAKKAEERIAAGGAQSLPLDESTDTEEVEVEAEAEQGSVPQQALPLGVGQAPLLPLIAAEDRMAVE